MYTAIPGKFSASQRLAIRPLSDGDFPEFQSFMQESRNSIEKFFDIYKEFDDLDSMEFKLYFLSIVDDKEYMHFGAFQQNRMLAYGCFLPAFIDTGLQLVCIVRERLHRNGVGSILINKLIESAWLKSDLSFLQATIDRANLPSRALFGKLNFEPYFVEERLGQGLMATREQLVYLCINPEIMARATAEELDPLDLILSDYSKNQRELEFSKMNYFELSESNRLEYLGDL